MVWPHGLTLAFFCPELRNGRRPHFVFAVMMRFAPTRLSPAMLCALVAVAGGLLGGTATVQGMRADGYGPVTTPLLFGRADAAVLDEGEGESQGELVATGCADCSERDLGYRWASLAAVRLPGQCPNDSWAFRRGCLDFVGGV